MLLCFSIIWYYCYFFSSLTLWQFNSYRYTKVHYHFYVFFGCCCFLSEHHVWRICEQYIAFISASSMQYALYRKLCRCLLKVKYAWQIVYLSSKVFLKRDLVSDKCIMRCLTLAWCVYESELGWSVASFCKQTDDCVASLHWMRSLFSKL